jgi:peptidoglycan/LPS O-acetylase OafA/YrhL
VSDLEKAVRRAPLRYRPELDGLRTVAVLLVMLRHTGQFGVRLGVGGFLGVDVFFVLSGYLITSLLLDEREQRSTISLGAFYMRRALRLVPALALTLVLVGVWWHFVPPGPNIVPFRRAALLVIAYVANWAGHLGPLGHAWSLAIEEQYYIVWAPLLALLLWKRVRPHRIAAAMLAIFVALFFLKIAFLADNPATGRGLVTYIRIDGLLIGNVLALWPKIFERARSLVLGWAAVGIAGAITLLFPDRSLAYPRGAFTLFVLCVAVIIAHVTLVPDGFMRRVLAQQPLPAIGRISYGLYLYHLPVFFFFHRGRPGGRNALIAWVLTFGIATASFFFFERPALRLKSRFERRVAEPVEPRALTTEN